MKSAFGEKHARMPKLTHRSVSPFRLAESMISKRPLFGSRLNRVSAFELNAHAAASLSSLDRQMDTTLRNAGSEIVSTCSSWPVAGSLLKVVTVLAPKEATYANFPSLETTTSVTDL